MTRPTEPQRASVLDDETIELGLLATTRKLCKPEVNGQETVFMEALGLTRSWESTRDTLEFLDEDNAVVVRFERQTEG